MVEASLDLRGGKTLWEVAGRTASVIRPLRESLSADTVIIGSGITGSFLAERLSRLEQSVIVLDRNRPQMASTAASTALLLWEIDTPLRGLAATIGFDKAAEIYRTSIEGVAGILELIKELDIHCDCVPRPALYLAGSKMGARELADEQRIREQAGIPSLLVSERTLADDFGFQCEAGLYDRGCAETDPVALARGLMNVAVGRGVRVFAPVSAVEYDLSSRRATILTDAGHEIAAKQLILANGYEMPSFVSAPIHRIVSTWVVATTAIDRPLWPNDVMVWEASDPYLYMRRTKDRRIIIGGEDEELTDAGERDKKIGRKSETLLAKLQAMRSSIVGGAVDYAWAGFFGTTEDGLPLIGRIPSHANVFGAFGYGGNGITFSAIAAELIVDLILGRTSPLLDSFSIDRDK